MKKSVILFCLILAILSGCKSPISETHVLSPEVWSEGCVELAPYQGSYRLSGVCCENVLLPKIELNINRSFSVNGTHHSYTGAGFNSTNIIIQGQISPDDNVLTLRYVLPHRPAPYTYRLTPNPAQLSCQCFCD